MAHKVAGCTGCARGTYVRGMDRRAGVFLSGAFLLSVAIRAPEFGRPLSRHHEFCTAVVLIILENWQGEGFRRHQGIPALNFEAPADKHIHPASYAFATRDGVFHYLSHPPLAYDIPYWTFRVLGLPPRPMGLTALNLLAQAVTMCVLWLVFCRMAPGPSTMGIPIAPAVASAAYLFMPAPLWFHANAYMADMFVQNPWAIHLLFAMRVLVPGDPPGRLVLAGFFLSLAITVYTNWLGLSVAAVDGGLILLRYRDRARPRNMMLGLTIAAATLPLLVMFMRYMRVLSAEDLLTYLRYRFVQRGTVALEEGGGASVHLGRLGKNYLMSWGPLLVAIPLMGMLVGLGRIRAAFATDAARIFLLLTGMPVLLDHALLLKYAEHDFATLKAGFFLCGALGLLVAQGWPAFHLRQRVVASAVVVGSLLAGARIYRMLNHIPAEVAHRWNEPVGIGTTIARTAAPDEVVFARGFEPEPQVQWYARRTMARVADLSEARDFLADHPATRGIVFTLEADSLRVERIHEP